MFPVNPTPKQAGAGTESPSDLPSHLDYPIILEQPTLEEGKFCAESEKYTFSKCLDLQNEIFSLACRKSPFDFTNAFVFLSTLFALRMNLIQWSFGHMNTMGLVKEAQILIVYPISESSLFTNGHIVEVEA